MPTVYLDLKGILWSKQLKGGIPWSKQLKGGILWSKFDCGSSVPRPKCFFGERGVPWSNCGILGSKFLSHE